MVKPVFALNVVLYLMIASLSALFTGGNPDQDDSGQDTDTVEVSVTLKRINEDHKIDYQPGRMLTYSDFSGRPDRSSPGVAATYSVISVGSEINYNEDIFMAQITVSVFMDCNASWMKKEGRYEHVLAHEQLHFDISAYVACRLMEAIRGTTFTKTHFKQQLKDLQQHYMQIRDSLQNQYDLETRHGTLTKAQAEWAQRISREFSQTNCY